MKHFTGRPPSRNDYFVEKIETSIRTHAPIGHALKFRERLERIEHGTVERDVAEPLINAPLFMPPVT